MLELTEISKSLSGKQLFSGLSYSFSDPVVILEGANGTGKTTLLRMITGVLEPDLGKISWKSRPSRDCREELGICPADEGGFYKVLTVRQNLAFFAALYGIASRDVESRIQHLCPFPLDFLDLPIEKCSLGMKQKAKLARAVLNDPSLLLLDEPLNGLDRSSREVMQKWLGTRKGLTLLVQHGLESGFPRVVLDHGKLSRC